MIGQRRFPQIVVPADSLRILLDDADSIKERLRALGVRDEEISKTLDHLLRGLSAPLIHFEDFMSEFRNPLPYVNAVGKKKGA
jgi:hypothetical protein